VHHLYVELKKAYNSIRSEGLYNILAESGTLVNLFRNIKMCLNETCKKFAYTYVKNV
jgi:hypothetical protein